MNTQYKETCKALEMLERSEILDINGYLLSNWSLNTLDCEDSEEVFSFSYSDEEGYIFEFSFTKKSLLDATVKDHTLSVLDDTGEIIDIACYSLQALN